MMKTVWIQLRNGGGIAGVWEVPPTNRERAIAYAAHLRVENTESFEASVAYNTYLVEAPVIAPVNGENVRISI